MERMRVLAVARACRASGRAVRTWRSCRACAWCRSPDDDRFGGDAQPGQPRQAHASAAARNDSHPDPWLPHWARSEPVRNVQLSAISLPPPAASPSIAAMAGCGICSRRRRGPGPRAGFLPGHADPWSARPVLAVAYDAKRIAAISVQLVKDVLRLLDGMGWPAQVICRRAVRAGTAGPAGDWHGVLQVIGIDRCAPPCRTAARASVTQVTPLVSGCRRRCRPLQRTVVA